MKMLLLLIAFILSTPLLAYAGHDQGGGSISQWPMPPNDFEYTCKAEISQTRYFRPDETPYKLISRQTFVLDKRYLDLHRGMFSLPSDKWEHGRKEFPSPENREPEFESIEGGPPYSLNGHFITFSFNEVDGQWNVSLRGNLVFKEKYSSGAAFSFASFSSPMVAVRLLISGFSGTYMDLSINCLRNK